MPGLPTTESSPLTSFDQLGLAEPIRLALGKAGYTTPTPIQLQAIPPAMAGHDLCGIAQTGTGKTAAFALPILDRLARDPQHRRKLSTRVLVLSPTRELASQIADSFRTYGSGLKLRIETVFGGVPINRQVRMMEGGLDILVATPGRLIDLIERGAILLDHVAILVLDEADQMLDLGFIHALKRLHGLLPRRRQSLFFSATMPPAIRELAAKFLREPVEVAVAPQATTAERVRQAVVFVNQAEKQALLTLTLRDPAYAKALVFTRTKHGADRVVRHLEGAGIRSAAIHGNKSQAQRERALDAFRAGQIGVLVATDIAARGIDIDDVSHVINFELPNVPEQYVHRIGRTARAGRAGDALSFCAPDERAYLKDIEKLTRLKVEALPLPADFLAQAAKLPRAAPASADTQADDGGHRRRGPHQHQGRGAQPQSARGGRGPQGAGRGHAQGERAGGHGRPGGARQGSGRRRSGGGSGRPRGEGGGRPAWG
jgi:ATP-dependent RNA helicase RhlE